MAQKPKSLPVSVPRTSRTGRDSESGRFKMSLAGSTLPQSPTPKGPKSLQARPTDENIDPEQFAKDLLVTDKWIMDFLAR